MDIPDLPPDVSFDRFLQTPEAVEIAFEIKRAALGPHVIARWEWDEAFQRSLHQQQFRERTLLRIVQHGQLIGTIALAAFPNHLRLDNFYLLPDQQGQGLGSRILEHCLTVADACRMPICLEYLKWNPVASLYRRHGFRVIDETENLFMAERQPSGS